MTSQNNQEIVSMTENPHSPYYLHHSDNHSSVIVTPELTTNNYSKWSRSFLLALSIRNKQGFVTREIPCPSTNDDLYSTWNRCNNLILSWLLRSISPPIATTIFYFTSASQIWAVLKKRFSKPNDSRICYLQQQLCVLTQGNKSVDVYFNELNTIWEELKLCRPLPYCSCGRCNVDCFERFVSAQEKDYVFKFLNGLNDSFRNLRSQIVMMKPFPSLDEAYNIVLSEESQRAYENKSISSDPITEAPALAFQSNKLRNPNVICSNCKKPGHVKEKCYFLIGFPQKNAGNSSSVAGGSLRSQHVFQNRRPQMVNSVSAQANVTDLPSLDVKSDTQASINKVNRLNTINSSSGMGQDRASQMDQLLPKVDQLLSLLQTNPVQSHTSSQPVVASSSAAGAVFQDYDWIR